MQHGPAPPLHLVFPSGQSGKEPADPLLYPGLASQAQVSRRLFPRLAPDRLIGGDTLVVVAIDRIGQRWPDTIRSICDLRVRGVKIRSLAEAEAQWTPLPGGLRGQPRGLLRPGTDHGRRLGGRPGAGVHQPSYQGGAGVGPATGQNSGPPRKFNQGQLEAVRRMREAGASLRRIAETFECSPNTVRRALQREGAAP